MRDGRILLARASERSSTPGTWYLPGGGVELGEHPEDAVVREVREETGLRARVDRLVAVLSDAEDELHTVRVVYRLVVEDAPLVIEVGGTTDAAEWVAQPPDPAKYPLAPFVARLLTNHPSG